MRDQAVLSAPRSPLGRAYVERIIGTIRRECLDHVDRLQRNQLALPPARVPQLLSSKPDASGIAEGHSRAAPRPTTGSAHIISITECTAAFTIDTSAGRPEGRGSIRLVRLPVPALSPGPAVR